MDQNTLVNEQVDGGGRFIEALAANGFDVRLAFWAKPTEEGKWYLYLASPFVDDHGPGAAYRLVLRILRSMPDLWIDSFDVKVLGLRDSLAEAVRKAREARIPDSPYAVRNPRREATWLGETTLAGVSMDAAYIYPPPHPAASA